jgi:hypothetical protein
LQFLRFGHGHFNHPATPTSGDTMNFKTLITSLAVAASAFGPALAQTYPAKTINLIVPYPAGGPSDFFARKVQPDAAAKLGQTMIIDNIGGAGGSIGMAKLVNAPADGYTLSLGSPMELVLAPMAIQGVKYKSEDFKLVAQFATTTTILAVRNSLNVKTVDDLLALARKNANKPLSYGSVGPGSLYHLVAVDQGGDAACALQRHCATFDRLDGWPNRHGLPAHGRLHSADPHRRQNSGLGRDRQNPARAVQAIPRHGRHERAGGDGI